jgi:hypothetical protein
VVHGRCILALTSLLWGFLQAPFDHIHPDEELEHQLTSAPVHLHGHETWTQQGAAIGPWTADDDEVDVLWSVTTTPHITVHASAALVARVVLPDLALAYAPNLIPRHRGHDPPALSSLIPRAPPA